MVKPRQHVLQRTGKRALLLVSNLCYFLSMLV